MSKQDLALIQTHSVAETLALGQRWAAAWDVGDVIALYGDLGAGKTHFVKGVCAHWDVPEVEVNSPTFTLINEYAGRDFPIYHFDAYRITDAAEFFELGYETYFYGAGLCLIEWPERVEPLLPEHTIRLRLTHAGGNQRTIERL